MRILLGSASPRRRELLEAMGHEAIVRPVDVDETQRPNEPAADYLARIVEAKRAGAMRFFEAAHDALLVADTIVVVDGAVLQKPADDGDARAMIRRLAGRAHEVTTRFSVANRVRAITESVTTKVVFRAMDDGDVDAYVATGEGRDKAGAYAIQGKGAQYVARIEGSYGAVVGLPSCEVSLALRALAR